MEVSTIKVRLSPSCFHTAEAQESLGDFALFRLGSRHDIICRRGHFPFQLSTAKDQAAAIRNKCAARNALTREG